MSPTPVTDRMPHAPEEDPPASRRRPRWLWVTFGLVGMAVVVVVLVLVLTSGGSAPTTDASGRPVVMMSPAPGSTTYHDGQVVQLSVGPNRYFAPYSRIVILECADKGGATDALPRNDTTCDGNTVQGYSVLVNKDGSFSASSYPLFSLPNTQLGEAADGEPVCNQTNACVLYVGQDQNHFTAPKVFSAPFTIVASHVPKKTP